MYSTAAADDKVDVQGLVFIDDNENGVWDAGEAGYGGELMWLDDEEVTRYVGATVTVTTSAYDEYTIETAGYREPNEDEVEVCTLQDLLVDDELNPDPIRPCSGTWSLPRVASDVYLTIELTPPAGYTVTSENPIVVQTSADMGTIDIGIAPTAD